ncbi:hypothetical protein SLEP1_g26537 [Rubroshorea leprosula]|uniref:Uncharacterized protein n=1 Tax=Rubroshorea leprosula TaxID=152421 RepID=A0AAV5JSU5_9ROSI|nr:hypothetical protein SLEP1_g26537 [Rubroshorea leprosula]
MLDIDLWNILSFLEDRLYLEFYGSKTDFARIELVIWISSEPCAFLGPSHKCTAFVTPQIWVLGRDNPRLVVLLHHPRLLILLWEDLDLITYHLLLRDIDI